MMTMPTSGHAGVLMASWTAPTTNTDGSALTNLAFYRVYYSTSDSPCPGVAYFEVASPSLSPVPNQTLSFQLTGLTTVSIYSVAITAVNASGKESACSGVASAIARDDSTAVPTVQDHSATGSATTAPTTQDHFTSTPLPQHDPAPTPPTEQDPVTSTPPPQDSSDTAPTHH